MNTILNDSPSAIHSILTTYSQEDLEAISKGGCISGAAHSHIYYHETSEFYDKWEDEILDFLENVYGYNAIHYFSEDVSSIQELKNTIVWKFIDLMASVHSPT